MSAARRLEIVLEDETIALPRLCVRARVTSDTENNFWVGLDGIVTDGGVFVATHRQAPPVGTLLLLQLQVGFQRESAFALASVRWVQASTARGQVTTGFGVQFVDIEPASAATVERFVRRIREPMFFDE